ncbi:uncharacterized protein FIBRA_06873 [Fibroporia radiculosa]|uniref:Peptidase S9 prolyl oligopeptidase catalytic domain-containing protein n=1 Tax=Fibroporia radiculosa TaxID=599839 RepID=J4HZS7_9APHY|nr:uncharacterized protein FIBRA_06873 [Fibroporia radiculosa]CCM04687.1 predicted protein [Fibroporia radiculosa]
MVSKQVLAIGGINVNVFTSSEGSDPSVPVTVLFFLHGRKGSAEGVEWVPNATLEWVDKHRKISDQQAQELVVVTIDQRNHGTRVADLAANKGWDESPPSSRNDRHAIDLYCIFAGTAQDISFLIDWLPAYLYPSEERTISQWIVAGLSLGGHAAWYTLRNDPRVKIGIPIIAASDYVLLISERAKRDGVPFEPPYAPKVLLQQIQQTGAVNTPYDSTDAANPFLGKKILALSGADDTSVPWSASERFFERLVVGESGSKRAIVYPGVGHKCTPEMVEEMSQFVWKEALVV